MRYSFDTTFFHLNRTSSDKNFKFFGPFSSTVKGALYFSSERFCIKWKLYGKVQEQHKVLFGQVLDDFNFEVDQANTTNHQMVGMQNDGRSTHHSDLKDDYESNLTFCVTRRLREEALVPQAQGELEEVCRPTIFDSLKQLISHSLKQLISPEWDQSTPMNVEFYKSEIGEEHTKWMLSNLKHMKLEVATACSEEESNIYSTSSCSGSFTQKTGLQCLHKFKESDTTGEPLTKADFSEEWHDEYVTIFLAFGRISLYENDDTNDSNQCSTTSLTHNDTMVENDITVMNCWQPDIYSQSSATASVSHSYESTTPPISTRTESDQSPFSQDSFCNTTTTPGDNKAKYMSCFGNLPLEQQILLGTYSDAS